MAPLDVVGTVPILLVGSSDRVEAQVWVANPAASDVTVTAATLTVTFPGGPESGPIGLPPDAAVPAKSTKRLMINMGLNPLTAPGTYGAKLDLSFQGGATQTIAASLYVNQFVNPVIMPPRQVFTGVVGGGTYTGNVVVMNKGNVAIAVGKIAPEAVYEVVAIPRVLAVTPVGAITVEPASGFTALSGKATFTNTPTTVAVGSWAEVGFKVKAPATVPSNAQLRVTPRIATERFIVDLLT